MYNKKMQYVIKSVPTDNKQALEDLLNNMSEQGWDLYTMHEIETDTSIDFNCIFVRERQQEDDNTDLDDIVNVTRFIRVCWSSQHFFHSVFKACNINNII